MRLFKPGYKHTLTASYTGYVIQAIVNNFLPLLFVTFQFTYGISIEKITLLITINFATQLFVDLICSKLADKIGYRKCVLFAHFMVAAGLLCLSVLPEVLPSAYSGLIISVMIYAVGGGLLEVVISPIVEACPTEKKSSGMSLLHSFYCWGAAGVILISTVTFWVFGLDCWRVLALVWMALPILNGIFFCFVPIYKLENSEAGSRFSNLFRQKTFWMLLIIMLCAGAAELVISQWSSTFAEIGLNISKEIGDLAGPFAFAILMGLARVLYSVFANRISLKKAIAASCVLCILSYLLAALSPIPILSLIGCALAGFSVGVLWPCTFSLASRTIRGGGTTMFAMLSLAGDLGCALGPTLVGFISSANGDLSAGLLFGLIFPVVLLATLMFLRRKTKPAPPVIPDNAD